MLDVVGIIIFDSLLGISCRDLNYENTTTVCGNYYLEASFYFQYNIRFDKVLTRSKKSEKCTTLLADNIILSTLDLPQEPAAIFCFLETIGILENKEPYPGWFESIEKFDDKKLKSRIQEAEAQISELENSIETLKLKLKDNALIKSILFSTGDALVSQVYRILEDLLSCDLSHFIDVKKETSV